MEYLVGDPTLNEIFLPFTFNVNGCPSVEYTFTTPSPHIFFNQFDPTNMMFSTFTSDSNAVGVFDLHLDLTLSSSYVFNDLIRTTFSFQLEIKSSCITATIIVPSAYPKTTYFLGGTDVLVIDTNPTLIATD